MEIIKGQSLGAPKLMLYGMPGSGKSTLASKLEKPIFIDTEGGLDYLGVDRTPVVHKTEKFYEYLVELSRTPEDEREYKTIVIDSLDWLVQRLIEKTTGIGDAKTMAERDKLMESTLTRFGGGYGHGSQVLGNRISAKLIPMLTILNNKGYTICLVAHAERREVMTDDGMSVERIVPKISGKNLETFNQWCDHIFYLKKDGDARKLVLESDDVVLAKNRLGKHGEVDADNLDWNALLTPASDADETENAEEKTK